MDDWRQAWIEAAGADAGDALERCLALAADVGDPARAEGDLGRFVEAQDPVAAARRFRDEPLAMGLLLGLGGISRFGMDLAVAKPEEFWTIVADRQFRQIWGRRALARLLAQDCAEAAADDAFATALNGFKRRHYLRLILGDLSGGLGFEALVAELSDLVDCIVQATVDRAAARLAARWPDAAVAFTVLGMGKLGARELNYSSDIDLIFCYEDLAADRGWDCHDYCQRLGADIIRQLDAATSAGRLFRVDMRLRPEGDRGELALSRREIIDYYYSVGRPWERQALIKARPIAGDLALGERLLGELRPWIYPQEPAWEELDGTRTMRRRIEERKAVDDVKTGAGGIRDIEFLVQFFQLSHGGRLPELRSRATLPTLRALADLGLVPRPHVRELERHYLWLRLVEHRLQVWEDRQLHEIPRAPIERAPLARRCGLRGDDALARFDVQLAETRARVRALADRHYLRATRHEDAVLALLVQDEIEDDLIHSVLDGIGFKDLRRAAEQLRQMAREPFFLLSRSRTERALAALLPVMLELVRQTPDADQTVVNLGRIVATVGGRATFYDLLAGNAKVLRMFCDLAGWANYLVALLAEVPGLPDELVDSLNLPAKRSIALLGEARLLTRGIQDVAPPLRFFQARELCTTAIRDLEGLAPERVSRGISDTALAILNAVLERCVGERARAWGLPVEVGRQTRFAVLGLGKLGSRELSYASDMDVVFVCDPGGTCRREGRSGEQFWTKVAQELMRGLGEGRLYDIDPRLRPWGDQGELVSTMPSLVTYWQTPKDLWERMAMLRVAPVAGETTIGAEAANLIRDTALLSPLPADAATQVRDMRRRLEESVAGRDHVKRGWGGYVDHEFIAHWLSFGVQPAELPIGATVADTLRRLAELGRLPSEAVADLVRGLALLRGVEARMRLAAGKAISSIPTSADERSELARRCQFASLADFDLALHDARQTGRRWFERLVV